jgi:hypothetical protein
MTVTRLQASFEEGFAITANRTVTLGFGRSEKARVLKSTIKFAVEKD